MQRIQGTCRLIKTDEIINLPQNTVILPSHNDILTLPAKEPFLMEATLASEKHIHHEDHYLVQAVDNERAVFVEKPSPILNTQEMDLLYTLPFTRKAHPRYEDKIPAENMMKTSMTCHRGCGGGCSFLSSSTSRTQNFFS